MYIGTGTDCLSANKIIGNKNKASKIKKNGTHQLLLILPDLLKSTLFIEYC